MKKMFLALCLTAAFGLVIVAHKGYAQEAVVETETPVGIDIEATKSAVVKERVNYELPYPGMLPDNPFYFLKALRDRVVKMLINDDMVMAKFSLNNAEKRVFAGQLLLEQKKEERSVESIMKGVNYYEEALAAIEKFREDHPNSVDIEPFLQKTKTSLSKSREVTEDMSGVIGGNHNKALEIEQKRIDTITQKVELLLEKK